MSQNFRPLFILVGMLLTSKAFSGVGYEWTSGNLENPQGSTITSSDSVGVHGSGTLGVLENAGSITSTHTGGSAAIWIEDGSTVSSIDNGSGGVISAESFDGIVNEHGLISVINNSGTISTSGGGMFAISNGPGTIGTITNLGTIQGPSGGIYNGGTIIAINNAQGAGNSAGALTYTGNLPTNYNIIVNSHNAYGRLARVSTISGFTNFGIYGGSILSKGAYTSVLSGLTAGTNVNAASGMHNGTGWRLVETGANTGIWDLIVDYSASNTLVGLKSNANTLSTVYNQQAAAYQAALSYDCQVYDAVGLCVSVGGRYTYAGPSPSSNQQAGLVIVGYKPVQTFRIGAFADQSVNISTPSGFSQSKSSPMWGLFAKWHMNKDETGLGVQASAVTSSSSLTATRPQLFNTEAGSGATQFNGQGYQLTTNYHQPVTNNTALVPYLGLRYTRINAGAYTENSTATVTSPLSYNAMAQNTFSVIGGIGVRSHLAEKLTGTASVGIQQNLNYSMGNYAGTSSIMGLESFSVQMPGNVNTMATATAGLFYDINKRERVGLNVLWQQQPFIATNTTTALATYTIGF